MPDLENKEDEKLVPLKVVEEMREKREDAERRANIAEGYARGHQDAAAAAPTPSAAPVVKELTRAELDQAVAESRMSQADADSILERQMETRVETKVTANAKADADAQAIATRTSTELDRYIQAIPGISDQTSAEFGKVKSEFDYLVGHGHPNNKLTELAAVRAAYGSVDKLEQLGKETPRETHQETGGGRDPGGQDAGPGETSWPKDIPAKNRQHYDTLINKGIMPDRKAALDEWNYKPKNNSRYAA